MSSLFDVLEPFARGGPRRPPPAACELCAAGIAEAHPHVLRLIDRALLCACRACAVLFQGAGAGGGRYRSVPTRVLKEERGSEIDCAALGIPVGLAYLVRRDSTWTAFLPSPGGVVEAPLADEVGARLAQASWLAAEAEPDVEALLVRTPRGGRAEGFLVPIDLCHELAAVVRRSWRGLSGGDDAERALEDFFERLRERAVCRRRRA